MGRTLLVALAPAALVAWAWLRLEEPRARPWELTLLAALALAPALLPRLRLRLLALVPAAAIAAWVALGPSPLQARPFSGHDFFGPFGSRVLAGLREYYDVAVPFDAAAHPEMHGLGALAVFGFCAAVALAVAARRPEPALLLTVAGVGWPATLVAEDALVVGALALAACLWILAALRRPAGRVALPALASGVLLVAGGVGLATTDSVAKGAVLSWQSWDAYDAPRDPVAVDYVWDGRYGGIEFPEEKTVVLRIRGPRERHYWRATTLDAFASDRWIEGFAFVGAGVADGPVPDGDPFVPEAASDPARWMRQDVEVVALADEHLVAAATPRAFDAASLGRVEFLAGGVVRRPEGLERGQRYRVWSYAPKPKPAELAKAGTEYPREAARFLDLGQTRVDPFGTPGREGRVAELFDRYVALWPYQGLYDRAVEVAGGAGSPYGAAVAIEAWLRDAGGFRYEEQPPRPPAGVPPLADFVDRTKVGYCQQFAGAMALMLRFLGVPARVAVGFTSGTYEDGVWTITDHDAHAWVEVWFPGHGWLPFDPTPGRGELTGAYTTSSEGFNARDTLDALQAVGGGPRGDPAAGIGALLSAKERNTGTSGGFAPVREHGPGLLQLAVLAALAASAALGLLKVALRRARYRTRDPRRLAAAARRELADFLVDQGLTVPPSATSAELAALVERELRVSAGRFAAVAGAARFGQPRDAAAAARQARHEVRALLRVVRARLTRLERLRGFVAVRSLRA